MRIESQNTQILQLTKRVDELTTQVITNQKECTNEIVRRETEILEMILDIEDYTNKIKNETRTVSMESRRVNSRIYNSDSSETVIAMIPQRNSTMIVENKRDEKLFGMIKKLKKKVSDDIKN